MEDWLTRAARRRPGHAAVEAAEGTLSYAQLDAAATVAARRLARLGVGEGERVATTLPPGLDFAALLHGAPRIGAALMPTDPRVVPADPGCLLVSEPLGGPEADVEPSNDLDPAAVHTVIHTSGTTGRAKAVELTAANHLASARGFSAALGADPADRWLCAMPLVHVGGLAVLLRAAVEAVTAVVHAQFDAPRVCREMEEGRVTLASLVPTMLHRLREAGLSRAPGLRAILLGGGPIPGELLAWASDRALPVVPTYGMTETASGVVVGSQPIEGAEIAIGADDEVLVRGPMVAPAEVGADGWLHTGDLGNLDEDGRLQISGRLKDVIVTGGENVAPARVEGVLLTHPEVVDAGVVGLPDPEWGERVVAFVVLAGEAASPELMAYCRARLSAQEVPKEVHAVPALPRNAAGKLMRAQLAARG